MEDLLSKIYDKVAFYEEDSMKLGKEFDTLITELLEPLRKSRTEEEVGEIRELIYQAAYSAEKYGFLYRCSFYDWTSDGNYHTGIIENFNEDGKMYLKK